MKKILIVVIVAVIAFSGGYFFFSKERDQQGPLNLYGNIDLRTVQLSFEEPGRVDNIVVEEGQKVKKGQLLAYIAPETYQLAKDTASAQVDVSQRNLDLILAGNRREAIAAAKARYEAALENSIQARKTCEREKSLKNNLSAQQIENACSSAAVAESQAIAALKDYDLQAAGARQEDIDVARAQLALAKTQLATAEHNLALTQLYAPENGVIRKRIRQPGDMVGPNAPVFEMALMSPLWAKVWIDEVNLGKVSPGQQAYVSVDAYPEKKFPATIGFISTVAEFTPKTVQTAEIRTSLVYEVRLTVEDPQNQLRLGMPVTVTLE